MRAQTLTPDVDATYYTSGQFRMTWYPCDALKVLFVMLNVCLELIAKHFNVLDNDVQELMHSLRRGRVAYLDGELVSDVIVASEEAHNGHRVSASTETAH